MPTRVWQREPNAEPTLYCIGVESPDATHYFGGETSSGQDVASRSSEITGGSLVLTFLPPLGQNQMESPALYADKLVKGGWI